MSPTSFKMRAKLAKGLGIAYEDKPRRTGSRSARKALDKLGVDAYVEEEATFGSWIKSMTPTRHHLKEYPKSLFPFVHWIGNYNLQWLAGDLVAGITVGAVVVPQSMAYAQLAELPVQYGLYTSFMGVLIYFFFATSKDITIGVSPHPHL